MFVDLRQILKALFRPYALEILYILRNGPLSVSELESELRALVSAVEADGTEDASEPAIYRQKIHYAMKGLRQFNLVTSIRKDTRKYELTEKGLSVFNQLSNLRDALSKGNVPRVKLIVDTPFKVGVCFAEGLRKAFEKEDDGDFFSIEGAGDGSALLLRIPDVSFHELGLENFVLIGKFIGDSLYFEIICDATKPNVLNQWLSYKEQVKMAFQQVIYQIIPLLGERLKNLESFTDLIAFLVHINPKAISRVLP